MSAHASLTVAEFRDTVIVLGDRSQAFGALAPDLRLFDKDRRAELGGAKTATEWTNLTMTAHGGTKDGGTLDLSDLKTLATPGRVALFATLPPDLARGRGHALQPLVVVKGRNQSLPPAMALIKSVDEGARKDFGLAARVTRIGVSGVDLTDQGFNLKVRQTMSHLETGREALLVLPADPSLPSAQLPDRLAVAGEVALPSGRPIILRGVLSAVADVANAPLTAEIATLARVESAAGQTTLVFAAPLANRYHAERLEIHGNCVSASQGESPPQGAESLGVSAPGFAEPKFTLKTAPVAHVPAPGTRGYAPALTVKVGPRQWTPVDSLLGKQAEDHVYKFRAEGCQGTDVQFAGPLPAGSEPVTALYRKGGGAAGNLEAGRISTLMTPVVGVRAASNPVASAGGADAEGIKGIRRAAPKSIRALDRLVSGRDYQAFALAYHGIGKALASELRVGMRPVLCLTIATSALEPPVPGSDLETGLRAALEAAGPPGRALRIDGFTGLVAKVTLGLASDPAFDRLSVETGVRSVLGAAFAADKRDFARALAEAEVIAAAQFVSGVVALQLNAFTLADGTQAYKGRLLCPGPRLDANGTFHGAGLLVLDPTLITFAEMLA